MLVNLMFMLLLIFFESKCFKGGSLEIMNFLDLLSAFLLVWFSFYVLDSYLIILC